jgi:hypothetical protein
VLAWRVGSIPERDAVQPGTRSRYWIFGPIAGRGAPPNPLKTSDPRVFLGGGGGVERIRATARVEQRVSGKLPSANPMRLCHSRLSPMTEGCAPPCGRSHPPRPPGQAWALDGGYNGAPDRTYSWLGVM